MLWWQAVGAGWSINYKRLALARKETTFLEQFYPGMPLNQLGADSDGGAFSKQLHRLVDQPADNRLVIAKDIDDLAIAIVTGKHNETTQGVVTPGNQQAMVLVGVV